MVAAFESVFADLKSVLSKFGEGLLVKTETPFEYALVTKCPSPFPQHRGSPLHFGSVRLGKAYVSYHLMPLYMCPDLIGQIPPDLKKRMQGKSCFNFKSTPGPELLDSLTRLTQAGFNNWHEKKWA